MYRDGEHIGQLYAEKDNLICERVGHFDNVLFNSLTSLMVLFAILFYLNCRHIATLGWPGYKCTRRLTHRLAWMIDTLTQRTKLLKSANQASYKNAGQ